MKPHLENALVGYGSGFHFAAPPPPDVGDFKYLRSPDPEEVLACVLANLQAGRFDAADALLPLLMRDDSFYVWSASANLIAHGAPRALSRAFVDWALGQSDESGWFEATSAALHAGNLWAVPLALEVHGRLEDPNLRSILETDLSWVLEESPAAIYAGPALVEPDPKDAGLYSESQPYPDDAAYAAVVQHGERALAAALGPAQHAAIAEGEPKHVAHGAQRLLARVRTPDAPRGRIEQGVRAFAASTGVDCRDFFDRDGNLRPLTAAAGLEEYLNSHAVARLEPGARYFFGHRIPE
jgi:hypothetical protein